MLGGGHRDGRWSMLIERVGWCMLRVMGGHLSLLLLLLLLHRADFQFRHGSNAVVEA